MLLFHTGFSEIRRPDVHYGRKNADFGQGFYLTADRDCALRWAREQRGKDTFLNTYRLSLDGLDVLTLTRDEQWFSYIYDNRRGAQDAYASLDVIRGPIVNDTIFDVLGITTSGLLSREQSLRLLTLGPVYTQYAIKTERAAAALVFEGAVILPPAQLRALREQSAREEREYQALFARTMERLMGPD